MRLVVGTCQFPTSENINSNLEYVLALMREAKAEGCDVVHFPEASLSGYAGADFKTHDDLDWILLASAMQDVLAAAGELGLWTILGSAHRLSGGNKPHNSLYIISDEGRIFDRYDKRFCSGDATEQTGDLAHYSSGDHFCAFDIKGCTERLSRRYARPDAPRLLGPPGRKRRGRLS